MDKVLKPASPLCTVVLPSLVPVRKPESLELSMPSLAGQFYLPYRQFGSVQSSVVWLFASPVDSNLRLPCPSPSSELAQTQSHRVGDASQPPHPLWSFIPNTLTFGPLSGPVSQHSTQFLSKRLSFFKLGSLPVSPLSVNVLAAVAMKMKPGPVAPSPISWILWMPLPGWSLKSRIWELLVLTLTRWPSILWPVHPWGKDDSATLSCKILAGFASYTPGYGRFSTESCTIMG